jgi:hypothetical protein
MAELVQQAQLVRHHPIFHDLAHIGHPRVAPSAWSRSGSCAGAAGAGAEVPSTAGRS